MNSQEVMLDLSKDAFVGQMVRIGQGDDAGTTIVAKVFDGGTPVTLSNATAKFMIRMPHDKGYFEDSHVNVSGNTLTYAVDEEHAAVVDGYTDDAYFQITVGSTVYSTSRFRVQIVRAASKGADPAGAYTDDIVSATKAARDAADAANAVIDGIGSAVSDVGEAVEMANSAVQTANDAIERATTAAVNANKAESDLRAAAQRGDFDGATGPQGPQGDTYEITSQDYDDIARVVEGDLEEIIGDAQSATTAANDAASDAESATERANAAIEAMGDISELAVPLMSASTRGGAKLGNGLSIDDGALSVDTISVSRVHEITGMTD